MKALKIIAVLVLVFIIAIVGIAVLAVSQIDRLAKEGIERGGTYAMGVETTVDSVDIGFLSGTFEMNGFNVANPEGYSRPNFLGLGNGNLKLETGSLQSDLITVPTLNLSDIELNLLKKDGKANYDAILDNLKRFESGDKAEPDPEAEGPGFIVNRIEMRNVKVHAALAPIGGDLTAIDVDLDEVVLTDVGDPSGVKTGELLNIIVKALLSAVANSGIDLPGDIASELTNQLAQLESLNELGVSVVANGQAIVGEASKALEDAATQGQKAIDDAGKAVDDLTKGIGGLLGGDKDEDDN